MAAPGLPLGAMIGQGQQALLAQQHIAARAAGAGQQVQRNMAAGGTAALVARQPAGLQDAAAAAAEANKRLAAKKRKAAEKPVPEKALHLIPESPLFNSLVMKEHHVDELIKKQRLELQAAATPLECPVHKRLRVYIFSAHSHQKQDAERADGAQPGQTQQQGQSSGSSSHDAEGVDPPQWTLTVWGRLENPDPPAAPKPSPSAAAASAGAVGISTSTAGAAASTTGAAASVAGGAADDASATSAGPAAAAAAAAGSVVPAAPAAPAVNVSVLPPQPPAQHGVQHKQPLSGFFRRVQFNLDPEQFPADNTITWEKLQHRGPHKDRFEVKRVGSQSTKVTITFEQDFVPPVYRVDPQLAEVLCMPFGQQQMVMMRLYSYIVSVKPQPDLSQLQLDDKLSAIFGTNQMPAAALPQALGRLLQPLEPVTVTHIIATSGPSQVTCVDFDVLLPVKVQDKLGVPAIDPLLEEVAGKQFEVLDQKVDASLAKLFEARRRRDMYLGFAEDPVAFLNTIIASQARELRVTRNNQVAIERRTDLFKDKWVDEAALRYLGRKSKQEGMSPALNAPQGQ